MKGGDGAHNNTPEMVDKQSPGIMEKDMIV